MNSLRMFLLFVGFGFLWFIVRQARKHWLGGPGRKELLEAIGSGERLIEKEAEGDVPLCPLCGSETRIHSYPHIKVWRCVNYPGCRGFVRAKPRARMKFASDWEKKNRRR